MHYKKQLYAWVTAILLCAAVAVAGASCGSSSTRDEPADGGTDKPLTTVAEVADKMVGCGYTGIAPLTRQLTLEFSTAGQEADGLVIPQAYKAYYQKLASAYLACMLAAPCDELVDYYCGLDEEPAERTLVACFTQVANEYGGGAPGSTFACSDGTALDSPTDAVCDGVAECADGSDETSKACATVQHVACDGKAVPYAWRCSNKTQCADGKDEAGCFVCGEGEVTRNTNLCDQREDCGSGADEVDCETFGCPPGEPEEPSDGDAGGSDPLALRVQGIDAGRAATSGAHPARPARVAPRFLHALRRARAAP